MHLVGEDDPHKVALSLAAASPKSVAFHFDAIVIISIDVSLVPLLLFTPA